MSIENTVLAALLYNEEYARKTLPFIQEEYFANQKDRLIFKLISQYVGKYNNLPSLEAIVIDLSNKQGVNESLFKETLSEIKDLKSDKGTELQWLLDQTEKWCQDRAIYNAIMSSIQILDDKNGQTTKGAIPQILSDALSVSFDTHIGHDFMEDALARYEFYHTKEVRVPFDLDLFNKVTQGGLPKKTLNVCLAGTGVGKSLFMCHCASANLMSGLNVLYITMEMAEERIAERIDANLLNLSMDELKVVDKPIFDSRLDKVRNKSQGRLIIKEYPTAGAHAGHFRALLEELKLKQEFAPDIIYIDYLNICSSQRLRYGANVNSYTYVKTIAEELRGLAVEYNVPIVSATQTTRSGFTNSDPGLEDTSESFGLPATVDLMLALISTEDLEALGQIMVKQLKNRYNDPSYYKRFVIGVDRSKMKLYDVEVSAQQNISDSGQDDKPVFDKSDFGKRVSQEGFTGFKF